ncbi:MAG: hypothetical protein HY422_03180, partial [Candidatus Komeilibacteria bacterium]|nr:hypothetical protein [Candidatus Komeilibacteria bacterium]
MKQRRTYTFLKSSVRPWIIRGLSFGIVVAVSFSAGRFLVWAQVWTPPQDQPPINNAGQPPTVANSADLLRKSPTTLQTMQGSLKGAVVSSVPVELGDPATQKISIFARNSYTAPAYPSGTIGVSAYAASTRYGAYGYADGTGINYGVMGQAGTSGNAAVFQGPVGINTNGTALGRLSVARGVTVEGGFSCLESAGCVIPSNTMAITANNPSGGTAVYGFSSTLPGIAINLDSSAGLRVSGYASLSGAGIAGYGIDGFYAKASGSDNLDRYNGIEGYAVTPGATDSFALRKGVYGLTDGGYGNKASYGGANPFDFAAGVRACVKNSTGVIQNKHGIYGTGGKYAGYFDGDPGVCTATDAVVVDAGGADFYGDHAIAADGTPIAAYFVAGVKDLRIAKCGRADCVNNPPGSTVLTTVDTSIAGYGPSIIVPSDGKPIVSYTAETSVNNFALKVLKCGLPDCSDTTSTPYPTGPGNKITIVYPSNVRNSRTSIGIGSDGFPVIAFSDNDLKFMKCRTADCSDTNAASPTGNITRTLDTTGVLMIPSVAVPPDGKPVISYYESQAQDLYVAKCGDSTCDPLNENFKKTKVHGESGGGSADIGDRSDITIRPGGNLPMISYLYGTKVGIMTCGLADCSDTNAASPTGNQISIIDYPLAFDANTSIIVAPNGTPRVAYVAVLSAPDELVYVICNNLTCSSYTVLYPDTDTDEEGYDVSAVLHPDGAVTMSYFNASVADLKILYCGDDLCETTYCIAPVTDAGNVMIAGGATTCTDPSINLLDGPDGVGTYTSIRVRANGNPVISYHDDDNGNLKIALCSDPACIGKTIKTLDPSVSDVGWFTSLAITTDDKPVVAYFDGGTNQNLMLAKCNEFDCSTPVTPRVVDSSGDVGRNASLELRQPGNIPIISYQDNTVDATPAGLKLVICGNDICTSGNIFRSLDTVSTAGWYTSLALDTDGLPVVSYHDVGGVRVLKVAKCGNADCSSGNTVVQVVPKPLEVGNQGQYNSIAIPADNLPVVSFLNGGGGGPSKLGIVKCSLPNCSDISANTISNASFGVSQSVGSWTSIAIAPDNGYPVIIHQDDSDKDLEFVKCYNAACSSSSGYCDLDSECPAGNVCVANSCQGYRATTIFSSGNLGTHGSIAIGNDGYPVMSFYAGDAYPAYPAFDR